MLLFCKDLLNAFPANCMAATQMKVPHIDKIAQKSASKVIAICYNPRHFRVTTFESVQNYQAFQGYHISIGSKFSDISMTIP